MLRRARGEEQGGGKKIQEKGEKKQEQREKKRQMGEERRRKREKRKEENRIKAHFVKYCMIFLFDFHAMRLRGSLVRGPGPAVLRGMQMIKRDKLISCTTADATPKCDAGNLFFDVNCVYFH